MKKGLFRTVPFLLAACMLLGSIALPVQAANPSSVEYLNTYVNTGNQRQDIIGVALTQVGYTEKDKGNDTKYGDWCSYPNQPWCAAFVSWCARQADVSTSIIRRNARAHPSYFRIPYYSGKDYTPLTGDLFFTKKFTHVGLVWYVEGEYFYCLEGNGTAYGDTATDYNEEDSYDVVINKRRISDYYFGVPAYEGCDGDHSYVKGCDTAHPHNTYYRCQTCGDQYYTGYTECVAGCSQCFSCGCSSSYAGYYLVSANYSQLRMRTKHSTTSGYVGYVTVGSVVYVHGINTRTGWAYIEYDGLRGHIQSKYLTEYFDVPAAPEVTSEKTDYVRGDDVTLSWNVSENAEQYRLKVFKDGSRYMEEHLEPATAYTLESLPAGAYDVQVIACNRSGASEAGMHQFIVRDTYTVTYDARSGSDAPEAQTQTVGEALTLSSTIPIWEGYTFLGWTDDAQGSFAAYKAGASLTAYDNITLYAVWKANDAAPQSLEIGQMPVRTVFLLGEELDTSQLSLRLTYSDGSGHAVTEGYSAEGFDSDAYGTKTVTVAYSGLTVAYEVQVAPYIPGDIDLNKLVNRDDVMQLLWHINFPATFTIEVPADFNDDDAVDRDDVMQLLWHISFPESFPLEVVMPEEGPPAEPDPGAGNEDGDITVGSGAEDVDGSEDNSTQSIAEGE